MPWYYFILFNVVTVAVSSLILPFVERRWRGRHYSKLVAIVLTLVNLVALHTVWLMLRESLIGDLPGYRGDGGKFVAYGGGIGMLIGWMILTVSLDEDASVSEAIDLSPHSQEVAPEAPTTSVVAEESSSASFEGKLRQLQKLHSDGVIGDEEFAEAKQRLLNTL